MEHERLLEFISKGRTDMIVQLFHLDNWKEILIKGDIKPIQWLVYYNDLTAIRMILDKGADLSSIDLNKELGHASFFGHWKICDFLIKQGANVNHPVDESMETPLHNALAKAGRPYYLYTIKVLVEHGANINAKTIAGKETGAFMRDVICKGETPLHRAAAYADIHTIEYLLEHGADKTAEDMNGISPIGWASEHLRPGAILSALAHGIHTIHPRHKEKNLSDHGMGWANAMDWNLYGEYLIESKSRSQ